MEKRYYVYILTSKYGSTLYTGVTNDIARRLNEHKRSINNGFTKRYNVNKLVFVEAHPTAESAITREKQIKGGSRKKKVDLIEHLNPGWDDLTEDVLRSL
jgi:putative endonuclease